MNPAKLFEEIARIFRRYAPVILVHGLLLGWLLVRGLDNSVFGDIDGLWGWTARSIDDAVAQTGIDAKRGYVLGAVAIAYLAIARWCGSMLTNWPPFLMVHRRAYPDELIVRAGGDLQLPPRYGEIESALRKEVEVRNRAVSDSGQPHPMQYAINRYRGLFSYYAAVVYALCLAVVWLALGSPYAVSPDRGWELGAILFVAWLAFRWRLRVMYVQEHDALGGWALREYARENENRSEDPLYFARGMFLRRMIEMQHAVDRHPATILQRQTWRLPQALRERLPIGLRTPYWEAAHDWEIYASAALRHSESDYKPPSSLSVDPFESQFSALLECQGAGLAVIAPQELGLSPAALGEGAYFDFVSRRHERGRLTIGLRTGATLEHAILTVGGAQSGQFVISVGDFPIERLAQMQFPRDDRQWRFLLPARFDENAEDQKRRRDAIEEFELKNRTELVLGHSYLIGGETSIGTRAVIAIQCRQIAGSEKLLLAWRYLGVYFAKDEARTPLPWWRPAAWLALPEAIVVVQRSKPTPVISFEPPHGY